MVGRRYDNIMVKRPEDDMGVTAELRAAILASPKSARQIGREAGLAGGTVSRFSRGQRNITLGAAERTAAAIGYSLRLVRPRKPRTGGR